MKPTKLILIFTAILLSFFFAILWLVDYSNFGIPEYIGNTKYQTYTITMFIIMAFVLILFQRLLIKQYPTVKIEELILCSILVCLFSQGIYQIFRQVWILKNENNNKTSDYFTSLGSSIILSLFIALSIAFELKKVNPILKALAPIAVLGLLFVFKEYFPNITW